MKHRHIYRQDWHNGKGETAKHYYFDNNGKPAFIIGFDPNDIWSKQRARGALLSLRANGYKFAVLTDYKNCVDSTPSEHHKKRIAGGWILSTVMYDGEAIREFEQQNYTDLTLRFIDPNDQQEYLIFRFYDPETYKEQERYFIPLLSTLKKSEKYKDKFPGSKIEIWEI